MKRREFFLSTLSLSASLATLKVSALPEVKHLNVGFDVNRESKTRLVFSRFIKHARKEEWQFLQIGECMGKIGRLLLGTEYVAGTLEGKGPEACRVYLTGLDCVTFYENVLCMTRILKKGKTTFDDFLAELTFTRYRGGKLTDYTSRLHYTSDWIYDNEKKMIVRNITQEIGGEEYTQEVSFMSQNPNYYRALVEFPEFVGTISRIEQEINRRKHWYIPKRKVKQAQECLRTGDIIAIATPKKGLDYAHTGLAFRDERGKVRFLHASSVQKKVVLDAELYNYLQSGQEHIGITVARPLEVRR
ncbi:MAG: N-acetylmuramoyl-L-alanine amidase-like domain-containing protein [Candidatus Aminicenantaceae bacterium]